MMVECGQPSSSASTTPVCPYPRSSDCRPVRIRSGFSSSSAFASSRATPSVSRVADVLFFDVDRAVGAFRKASRMVEEARAGPEAQGDDFAAVLLFELQTFFKRVRVGLIDLERQIVLLNPSPAVIDAQLRVARGHLFDSDDDLHER